MALADKLLEVWKSSGGGSSEMNDSLKEIWSNGGEPSSYFSGGKYYKKQDDGSWVEAPITQEMREDSLLSFMLSFMPEKG